MRDSRSRERFPTRAIAALVWLILWPPTSPANGQHVAFAPDGKIIASGKIVLWDPQAKQQSATLDDRWALGVLAFSPDGRTLASGQLDGSDASVVLWDPQTGIIKRALSGSEYDVYSVAFSPDGKWLAAGSTGLKVWDVETGRLLFSLPRDGYRVASVAFSPDGKWLAAGESASDSGPIKLIETRTGQVKRRLTGHTDSVDSLAFSSSSDLLASGSRDGTVKVWDMQRLQQMHSLKDPRTGDRPVSSVCFSPTGTDLATLDPGELRLWNAKTGKLKAAVEVGKNADGIAFSPDGSRLAVAPLFGAERIEVIDVASIAGPPQASFTGKWDTAPSPLALTVKAGKVTGEYDFFGGRVEGLLAQDGKSIKGTWTQTNGASGGFELTISPDSLRIEGRRWSGDNASEDDKSPWSGERIGEPQFVHPNKPSSDRDSEEPPD